MLRYWRTAGLALFLTVFSAFPLRAADVRVGLLRDAKTLAAGVAMAKSGDRVLLDPGIYLDDSVTINAPLTIEGAADGVILRVTKPLANHKGILVVNANLTVRNLTFDGARVTDADGKNGAGIRHQAGNLTVDSCVFSANQDGMLINPGENITVAIRRTTFSGNGAGDGYTHAIYANAIGQLTVTDSTFTGTRVGHDIKSRALKTTVTNSVLDDGVTGTPSYAIDLPNGGEVFLQGLRITQGAKTSNTTMIAYGAEGSLHPNNSFTLRDSTLISTGVSGIGVNNFTTINVSLINNTFQGLSPAVKGPNQVGDAGRTLRLGAIYSGANADAQSYLRFQNVGAVSGNVKLTLFDGASGKKLTEWTSPSIAPNAAPQYAVSDIEKAGNVTPHGSYTLQVEAAMTGFFQHVLFRPADGTLTNATSCDAGVERPPLRLGNVHSSRLAGDYASTVVIQNTGGATTSAAIIGIYDARTGTRLGAYTSASIPPDGQLLLPMTAMESAAHITPDTGLFHYDLKIENDFVGALQQLVDNRRAGVTTDMTTVCSLQAEPQADTPDAVRIAGVFSSAQTAMQSYLRVYNAGTIYGQVHVTLYDGVTGDVLSRWTSPMIAPGASPQFAVADMESTPGSPPQFYAVSIDGTIKGSVQHVLYRPSDGTLTNLSTCDEGTTDNRGALANVHSSLLDAGYASALVIYNAGSSSTSAQLTLFDARDGSLVGSYQTGVLPPESQIVVPVASVEAGAGVVPGIGMFHYNIKTDAGFTGILQQLVDNRRAGVITDMTTVCALSPS